MLRKILIYNSLLYFLTRKNENVDSFMNIYIDRDTIKISSNNILWVNESSDVYVRFDKWLKNKKLLK